MSTDSSSSNSSSSSSSSSGSDNIAIVRKTLKIYGSLYLCSVVLCVILRKKYPRLFNVRSWGKEKCKLALEEYGWVSWFWEVFRVTDEDLQEQCGMDAVCFLRALRFGRKLTLMGCFNAIWLIPMYRTAEASSETANITDPFQLISVANLPSRSTRFVGTVIAAYIAYFYTMYLIFEEYQWFTEMRHKFLTWTEPRNYAVYVSGIPTAYRSSQQLENYFRQCSKDSVLEAHVAMETPKLDKLVGRRKALIRKLEHAVALEQKTGKTETHHTLHLQRGVKKVDSVHEFEQELAKLNRSIARNVREILGSRDPRRSQLFRHAGSKDILSAIHQDVRDDLVKASETEGTGFGHRRCWSKSHIHHSMVNGTTTDRPVLTLDSSEKGDLHIPAFYFEGKYDGTYDVNGSAPEIFVVDPEMEIHGKNVVDEPTHDDLDKADPEMADFKVNGNDYAVKDSPQARDDVPTTEVNQLVKEVDGSNEPSQRSDSGIDVERGLPERQGSRNSLHRVVRRSVVSGSNAIGMAGTTIANGSQAARTTLVKTSKIAGNSIAKTSKIAGNTIAKGSRVAGARAEQLIQTAGDRGVETFKLAQNVGSHVITSAGAVVPLLLTKTEGNATDSGFVVFTSLYATQTALQMIHHPKPYTMNVSPAGDPQDIFWRNVGLPHRAKRSGLLAAVAASAVLCFFWSIPMAFVTSLTEIKSLKEALPKLGELIDTYPWLEIVFAQIAPLLLLIFNQVILSIVLRHFATWEGHISAAVLEASLFVKMGCFTIIQTFFVQAISGSISAELANILNDPASVIQLLSNSLPSQSSYFIQVALAQTFFLQSMVILRVLPLTLALLRCCFGPRLTAKERSLKWGILSSLEDPPEASLAETFAQLILLYMVSFVYGAIAPVTSFFLFFCFILIESGYRYQIIHNYPRGYDSGGRIWKHFIGFILVAMIVSQLTLIGLLALKQSRYAGPALGPLLAVTCLFTMFLNAQHSTVSEYLPTRDCILKDSENTAEGVLDMDFVKGAYLQPSLQDELVKPDYEDDDDDEEGDDSTDR